MDIRMTASAIIYKSSDPERLFGEIKDDTYPHERYRNRMVLIGGRKEDSDETPKDTLLRELAEELSINGEDREVLKSIVWSMNGAVVPFKKYLYRLPGGEGGNEWREIMAILLIPLPDLVWESLERLQRKHANLSIESFTSLVSLKEIIEERVKMCPEMGAVLRDFFRAHNNIKAEELPLASEASITELRSEEESWKSLEDAGRLALLKI
jgi:8-oxo-dGTP pyrophosphatase MutT (NUDIX family)